MKMKTKLKNILFILMLVMVSITIGITSTIPYVHAEDDITSTAENYGEGDDETEEGASLGDDINVNTSTEASVSNPDDPDYTPPEMENSDGDDHSASMQGEEGESFIYAKDISVVVTDPSDKYIKLAKKGSTKTIVASTVTTGTVPVSSAVTCESKNPSVVSVGKTSCKVKAKKKSGTAVIIVRSKSYSYRLTAVQVVIGNSKPSDVDNSIMEYAVKYGEDISLCYETSYMEEKEEYDIPAFNSCIEMVNDENEVMKEGYAPSTNGNSGTSNKYTCPKTINVKKGKTVSIGCTPAKGDKITKYKSNKTSVATVTQKGKVKGIKNGTAKIKVSTKKGRTKTVKVVVSSKKVAKKATTKKKKTTKKKTTKTVKVKKVKVTNCPKGSIKINQGKDLGKTVTPTNAKNKNVTWSSNKQNIVSVDSKGKIKGLAKGNATITAKAKDGSGKKGTCKVTVTSTVKTTKSTVKPTKMTSSKTSLTLPAGNYETISLTWEPTNATKTVSWKSSNKKVAIVDSKGKITGVAPGTATITATSSINNKLVQKITVTVTGQIAPTSIKLDKYDNLLAKGKSLTLSAIVGPADATNKEVNWKSSDTKIATVNSKGVVKGIKAGQVKITATSKIAPKVKATAVVVVSKDGKSFLSLLEKNLSVGQTYNLSNKVISEEKAKATYSSNKTNIVTVDNSGKVTAIKKGTAVVSVTLNGKTEKCKFTIKDQEPTSISTDIKEINNLQKGKTKQITTIVLPENAVNKKVTWSTSNKKVATVSNGIVKGVKKGTATITAKTSNGKTATVKVSVTDDAKAVTTTKEVTQSIDIVKKDLLLGKTGKYKLKVVVSPDGANNKVTWLSSNPSVVSVTSEGVVEGLEVGTATITATSVENKTATNSIVVIVQEEPIKAESFIFNDLIVVQGEKIVIEPIFTPDNTTNQAMNYTIDNTQVATVDKNGILTGLQLGKANITGISVDNPELILTKEIEVVQRTLPTGVKLNKSTATITAGKKVTLKASVEPSSATNKSVIWKSSDTKVASVYNGEVKGVKKGTATITVTTAEGNKTATCKVTVKKAKKKKTSSNNNSNSSSGGSSSSDGSSSSNSGSSSNNSSNKNSNTTPKTSADERKYIALGKTSYKHMNDGRNYTSCWSNNTNYVEARFDNSNDEARCYVKGVKVGSAIVYRSDDNGHTATILVTVYDPNEEKTTSQNYKCPTLDWNLNGTSCSIKVFANTDVKKCNSFLTKYGNMINTYYDKSLNKCYYEKKDKYCTYGGELIDKKIKITGTTVKCAVDIVKPETVYNCDFDSITDSYTKKYMGSLSSKQVQSARENAVLKDHYCTYTIPATKK